MLADIMGELLTISLLIWNVKFLKQKKGYHYSSVRLI